MTTEDEKELPPAAPSSEVTEGIEKNELDKPEEEILEIIADEENGPPDWQKKITKTKEDLKNCETEKKEYLAGWQRAKADFINYRKDEGKRFQEMAVFVAAGLVQEILPVLDSFNLALSHNLASEAEKGILLIRSQLEDILKKRGLEQIKVVSGEDFNPEKHESIGEAESDLPEGKIVEEIQRGYLFQGKVLRPARVKLAKNR